MLQSKSSVVTTNEISSNTADAIFEVFKGPFGEDRASFDCILNLVSTHVALRSIGERVISFATLTRDRDELLLGFIATHPSFQGQSHADYLLKIVDAFAVGNNVKKISVDIEPERQQARRLFIKNSYRSGPFGNRFEKLF